MNIYVQDAYVASKLEWSWMLSPIACTCKVYLLIYIVTEYPIINSTSFMLPQRDIAATPIFTLSGIPTSLHNCCGHNHVLLRGKCEWWLMAVGFDAMSQSDQWVQPKVKY